MHLQYSGRDELSLILITADIFASCILVSMFSTSHTNCVHRTDLGSSVKGKLARVI